jgi:hypothetical protein
MNEIYAESSLPPRWTAAQLQTAVVAWAGQDPFRSRDTVGALAARVGPHQFVRLLTMKGAELEALDDAVSEIDGRPTVTYGLTTAAGG